MDGPSKTCEELERVGLIESFLILWRHGHWFRLLSVCMQMVVVARCLFRDYGTPEQAAGMADTVEHESWLLDRRMMEESKPRFGHEEKANAMAEFPSSRELRC